MRNAFTTIDDGQTNLMEEIQTANGRWTEHPRTLKLPQKEHSEEICVLFQWNNTIQ